MEGRPMLSLAAAAVLGGAVALGGGALLGLGDDAGTTTVVQQAPLAAGTDAPRGTDGGLTAAEIYERLSPGVVFVRAQIVEQVDTPFGFGPAEQRSEGTGTGFVIEDDGKI